MAYKIDGTKCEYFGNSKPGSTSAWHGKGYLGADVGVCAYIDRNPDRVVAVVEAGGRRCIGIIPKWFDGAQSYDAWCDDFENLGDMLQRGFGVRNRMQR